MEKREVNQVGKTVVIKQDEGKEYSGEEFLRHRADVDYTSVPGEGEKTPGKRAVPFKGNRAGLGSVGHPKEEEELRRHKQLTKWYEPHPKKKDQIKQCPVCGTEFPGRSNRKYCSDTCSAKNRMRKMRAKKREVKDFKPYRGKSGEVYFLATVKGKDKITFLPALYATDRAMAGVYLKENYDKEDAIEYTKQVEQVIRK